MTVLPAKEPALALSEWIVLSLVCEGVTHGNAVTQHLARYGGLGQVWNVQKAVVYRSLDRLLDLGLIRSAGEQRSHQGPVRLLVDPTETGQAAAGGNSNRSSTPVTSGLSCWSSWPCWIGPVLTRMICWWPSVPF